MTKIVVAALALSAAALAVSPALAQTVPAVVNFTTIADMPSRSAFRRCHDAAHTPCERRGAALTGGFDNTALI